MYKRILAALDMREPAVFEAALSLASATGAYLMLIHVLSNRDSDSPMTPAATAWDYSTPLSQKAWEVYQKQWKAYAQQGLDRLQDYVEKAAAAGVKADFLQTASSPEQGICQSAETWRADLIVVGSRRRKGLQELLLGSVSNYVMHHAGCSVLIVSLAHDPQERSADPTFSPSSAA